MHCVCDAYSVPVHKDGAVEMAITPPSRVDLVGSYLLQTMLRPGDDRKEHEANVDVTVEIPNV